MILKPEIYNTLRDYSLKNKDKEVCGFIVKNSFDVLFIPIINNHPNDNIFFLISPKDYLSIKNKYCILYLFHSHLQDTTFSETDLKYQKYHNINMLLYRIPSDLFEEKCVNTI